MPTASTTGGLTLRVSTTGAAEPGGELCTEALKVAVRSAEAPAELLAAADLIVEGLTGLREFLQLSLA
jgi:hypothetical protein